VEKFFREYLVNLGIYELRSLARTVGVKSPTTKKHSELVDCILKVQSGEQQAFVSKKGRPPKTITMAKTVNYVSFERAEGLPTGFEYAEDSARSFNLCNDEIVDGINKTTFPCKGLLREVDGKKYIYNYSSSRKFVFVDDPFVKEHNLKKGDLIIGTACPTGDATGFLDAITDINFNSVCSCQKQTQAVAQLCPLNNIKEIYEEIKQEQQDIKMVVELEVPSLSLLELKDHCLYFSSEEREDVQRSYNAVLNCKNLINKLSEQNKPFTLRFIDIDYIYSVINAYNTSKGLRADLDAGQFIKEILLDVKKCNGSKVIFYEVAGYKRNSYLDAILNKYL